MELQEIYTTMRKLRKLFLAHNYTKEVIEAFFTDLASGYDQKIISKYFDARGNCGNIQDVMSLLLLIFYHKRLNLRIGFMIELNPLFRLIEHNRFYDLSELGVSAAQRYRGHNGTMAICTKDFIEDDVRFGISLSFKYSDRTSKNFVTKISTKKGKDDQFIDINSDEFKIERKSYSAGIIRHDEEIVSEFNEELLKLEPFEFLFSFKTNCTFEDLLEKLRNCDFDGIQFEIVAHSTNVDDKLSMAMFDQFSRHLKCVYRTTTEVMTKVLKSLISNKISGNIVVSDNVKLDLLRALYTKPPNTDKFIDVFSRGFWNFCIYIFEYDTIKAKVCIDDLKYHFLNQYMQLTTSFQGTSVKLKIYDTEIEKTVARFVNNMESYMNYQQMVKTLYFDIGVSLPQMLDMEHLANVKRNMRIAESFFKSELKNNLITDSSNTIRKNTNAEYKIISSVDDTHKYIVSAPISINPSGRSNLDSVYNKNINIHEAKSDPGTLKPTYQGGKVDMANESKSKRFSLNSKESIVDRKYIIKPISKNEMDWKVYLKSPWNNDMNFSGETKSKLNTSEQFFQRAFMMDNKFNSEFINRLDNSNSYPSNKHNSKAIDLDNLINIDDKNNGYSLSEKINEAVYVPIEPDIIQGNVVESMKFSTSVFSKRGNLIESLSFSQKPVKEKPNRPSLKPNNKIQEESFNLMAVIEENPESANFNSYTNSKSKNSSKANSLKEIGYNPNNDTLGLNQGKLSLRAYSSMVFVKDQPRNDHYDCKEIHNIEKTRNRLTESSKGRYSITSNTANAPISQIFKPISQTILSEKLSSPFEITNNLVNKEKNADVKKSNDHKSNLSSINKDRVKVTDILAEGKMPEEVHENISETNLDEVLNTLIQNRATDKNKDLVQNTLYLKRLKRKILGYSLESVETRNPQVLSFGNMDSGKQTDFISFGDDMNRLRTNSLSNVNHNSNRTDDENNLVENVRSDLSEYLLAAKKNASKQANAVHEHPRGRAMTSKKASLLDQFDFYKQIANKGQRGVSRSVDQNIAPRRIVLSVDLLKVIVGVFCIRKHENAFRSKGLAVPRRSLPEWSKERNIYIIYRKIMDQKAARVSFQCIAKCIYGFIRTFKLIRIQNRKKLKTMALNEYNKPKHFPLDMSFARVMRYRFKILVKVLIVIKKLYRHIQINRVKRQYYGFLESPADKRKKLMKTKRNTIVKCVYMLMKLYKFVQLKRIKRLKDSFFPKRTKSFIKRKNFFVSKIFAVKVFLNLLQFVRRKASSKKTYRYAYTKSNHNLKTWKKLITCSNVLLKLYKHVQMNKGLDHKKGFLYLQCGRFMKEFRKQWKFYKVFIKLFRFVKRKNKRGRIKLKFPQCNSTRIHTRIFSILTFIRLLKFVRNKKINKKLGAFVEKRSELQLKRVSVFKKKLYCIKVLVNLYNLIKKRIILKKHIDFCKVEPLRYIRKTKYKLKSISHVVKTFVSLHKFTKTKRFVKDNRYFLKQKYKGYLNYLNMNKISMTDLDRMANRYKKFTLVSVSPLARKWKRMVVAIISLLGLYKRAKRSHLGFRTVKSYNELLKKLKVKNPFIRKHFKTIVQSIIALFKLYRVSNARRITKRPKYLINKRKIVKPKPRFKIRFIAKIVITMLKLHKFIQYKRITRVKTAFAVNHKQSKRTLKKIKPVIKSISTFLSLYGRLLNQPTLAKRLSLKTLTRCILAFLKNFKLVKKNISMNFIQRNTNTIKRLTFKIPNRLKIKTIAICISTFIKMYKKSKYYTDIRENRLKTLASLEATPKRRLSFKTIGIVLAAFIKLRTVAAASRYLLRAKGMRSPKYITEKYMLRRQKARVLSKSKNKLRIITKCIVVFLKLYKSSKVSKFQRIFSFTVNSSIHNFKSMRKMIDSHTSLSPQSSIDMPIVYTNQLGVGPQTTNEHPIRNKPHDLLHATGPKSQPLPPITAHDDQVREPRNSNYKSIESTLSHLKKIIQPVSSKRNSNLANQVDRKDNKDKTGDSNKDGVLINTVNVDTATHKTQTESKNTMYNIDNAFIYANIKSVDEDKRSKVHHDLEIATVNWMAQYKVKKPRFRLYTIAVATTSLIKLLKYVRFVKEETSLMLNDQQYSFTELEVFKRPNRAKLIRKFKVIAKTVLLFVSLYKYVRENTLLNIYNDHNKRDLSVLNLLDNYVDDTFPAQLTKNRSVSYISPSQNNFQLMVDPNYDTSSFTVTRMTDNSGYNHIDHRSTSFERKRAATSLQDFYNNDVYRGYDNNGIGMYVNNTNPQRSYTLPGYRAETKPIGEGFSNYIAVTEYDNYDNNDRKGTIEINDSYKDRQGSITGYRSVYKDGSSEVKKLDYEVKRTMSYQPQKQELRNLSSYLRRD